MKNSAGRAKKLREKERTALQLAATAERREVALRLRVAKLYGRGLSRQKIAAALYEELTARRKLADRDTRLQLAIRKLRKWENEEEFRNLVWDGAVAELDMDAPLILRGVSRKARTGRVDAAKLALAVTGRHQPLAEQGGLANVQIVFATELPRPALQEPRPPPLSREVRAISRQARPILESDEAEADGEWIDATDMA